MARQDWMPITDAGLLAFTDNFGRIINLTPADYNLTPAATTAYLAKQTEYATRLQTALDPGTRGKRATFLKEQSKKELTTLTRQIGRQINNLLSVNDEQRQELGLRIRSTNPTPRPAPDTRPFVKVLGLDGRIVSVQLQQNDGARGKPAFVTQASVFMHIGPTAPASVEDWQFGMNVTRTRVKLPFPPSATGDTAWITAFWTNGKGQSGPAATPISVNLPAGGVLPSEVNENPTLRIAA